MTIVNKAGRMVFMMRVPKRFQHLDRRTFARIALGTDSRREAEAKAPQARANLIEYWEALADGRDGDAQARYDAVRRIAHTRGVEYIPAADLAAGDLRRLADRLDMIDRAGH